MRKDQPSPALPSRRHISAMARSMLLAWTIATFKPYRSEHEATRADQPAGNPQAPGPEPGGILDQDRRNTKRRLALRKRPCDAQAGSPAAAPGPCRADRPQPGEKRGLRDHRPPEIAASGSLSEPAQGGAKQAQEARGIQAGIQALARNVYRWAGGLVRRRNISCAIGTRGG